MWATEWGILICCRTWTCHGGSQSCPPYGGTSWEKKKKKKKKGPRSQRLCGSPINHCRYGIANVAASLVALIRLVSPKSHHQCQQTCHLVLGDTTYNASQPSSHCT
ncbi:hypothetical protein M409DRAFT_50273 [Zasmidium cellare ATCC 36951]|uniref:Secreted protein n=1 Tax=Zasmidium cellare ATCC 36951 TaxID=1080233 RepID=A0A6A6CZL3_ZASCE|nr:uncharacterized protein M409DRAFT_50273 [Zasmidium cellare ATCC 36951]KAF2171598.1 hypothetical protein M409DRAFT_50273 [Zasmidium cellare ATCC 36951]